MPQYFTGKKASSFSRTVDPTIRGGYKEEELRMCAHCGYQWVHKPGSGKKRGVCLQCNGLTCGKPECMKECMVLEKRMDLFETGQRATF